MKLSNTQRTILTKLTADGWAIRRNPIDQYELCPPRGKSGTRVRGPVLGAMRRAGWLTDRGTAGRCYTLTDAGRARAAQERAA